MFRIIAFKYLHDSNAEYSDTQLFKGSYFSLASSSRHLWPYLDFTNDTMYVNYVLLTSK